jgi:hypothetical protein
MTITIVYFKEISRNDINTRRGFERFAEDGPFRDGLNKKSFLI